MVQVCIRNLNPHSLTNYYSKKNLEKKQEMTTLIWVQAMIIWMRKPLLLRCETRIAILLCTLFKPLCSKQIKELRLKFAALNLFCYEFALLLIITTSCLISLYRVIVLMQWRNMKRRRFPCWILKQVLTQKMPKVILKLSKSSTTRIQGILA